MTGAYVDSMILHSLVNAATAVSLSTLRFQQKDYISGGTASSGRSRQVSQDWTWSIAHMVCFKDWSMSVVGGQVWR